jgi:acyl-coenzyme A thioesterase 13
MYLHLLLYYLPSGSRSLTPFMQGWGSEFFASGKVKLVDASAEPAGRAVFEFMVDEAYCNRLGNQHGGCTATLFDICTTVALAPIARPGFWAYAGVTRTLSLTYLRPMALGEEIVLECEVVHAGKRMCLIKGVMKRKKDGAITATCEHGKASIDPEMPSKL